MKKVLLTIAAVISLTAMSYAQKGAIKLGIGAEVAFPTGDLGDGFSTGFGGSAKGYYGVSDAGDVTLSVGYLSFSKKNSGPTAGALPILVGYRHSFSGFFVEPQVGYTNYSISNGGGSAGGFDWAINAGYGMKSWEASVGYNSASVKFSGVSSTLSYFGVRVAYNFSLSGSSEKK
jgi:hypothetical protein